MTTELIAFLVMVGVFLLGCFLCKLPVSLSMVLASVAGAIAGGQGLALRHLVEGMFAYVDTIMVIATAMIFMKVIQESGALDAIASLIIQRFHKVPALMLIFIMIIIMFPGMITGSSTASVLSAGSIMAPVLMLMGVPVLETACILALGGVLAAAAVLLKMEFLVAIAGLLYVIEALSVIIQVVYFKKTRKRFFKMAPIHHHFELCGMKEKNVVYMFWAATLVFCMLAIVINSL